MNFREASSVRRMLSDMSSLVSDMSIKHILSNAQHAIMGEVDKNSPPLSEEEKNLIKDKKIIPAIKSYRERTGMDLMSSKAVVDHYRDYVQA